MNEVSAFDIITNGEAIEQKIRQFILWCIRVTLYRKVEGEVVLYEA